MKAVILIIILITTTLENEHQPFNWTLGRWEGPVILKTNVTAGAPSFLNRVITKQEKKKKKPKVENSPASVTPGTYLTSTNKVEETPRNNEPLWAVMQAAYQALNATSPNFTISCWLCYDIKPPFYKGIAVPSPFNTSTEDSPSRCNRKERKTGITLQQVRGSGWCIGKVTNRRKSLCTNQTRNFASDVKWVLPSPGAWWICSITGLTPCLSTAVLKKNVPEFCVQVTVVPRILLHGEETMYLHWDKLRHKINKREPVSAITIAALLSLGATGTATGLTSLVQQPQSLTSLRAAIDENLARVENSISYLEK
ncbi:MLV-related proviral Env polyprotein-like [Falco biarmicus]|uniref:MLV-related proviral Env polyprotein-like n=1 Tax=Falco cherrug TaxID=345164 RepID=UPI00247A159C|nr:MLV-related proviral Env polyprotein-like [Falco cherrug]XP_055556318.1 MLV-related proviral Env polyprotein-like [Falco cherrug]XP_056179592.1 MLV-related proviral Env polyprotein-like [Falco biarmicus]XP_056179593.1 MLV-related proviral Env polyprotein-like [Falco biarmicus]